MLLPSPLQTPCSIPNPLRPPPGSKQMQNKLLVVFFRSSVTSREPSPKMEVRIGVENMVMMVNKTATLAVMEKINYRWWWWGRWCRCWRWWTNSRQDGHIQERGTPLYPRHLDNGGLCWFCCWRALLGRFWYFNVVRLKYMITVK